MRRSIPVALLLAAASPAAAEPPGDCQAAAQHAQAMLQGEGGVPDYMARTLAAMTPQARQQAQALTRSALALARQGRSQACDQHMAQLRDLTGLQNLGRPAAMPSTRLARYCLSNRFQAVPNSVTRPAPGV